MLLTAPPSIHRFNTAEFDSMVKAGVFARDDRVELVEGLIITMSPIGPTHAAVVNRLARLLIEQAGTQAVVTIQSPISLDIYNRPQPDVAVCDYQADTYALAHPQAHQVGLVIEVADSSLTLDLSTKVALYASAGIPVYWVVNLPERCVEVFTQPAPGGYAQHNRAWPTEAVVVPRLGVSLAVRDILG